MNVFVLITRNNESDEITTYEIFSTWEKALREAEYLYGAAEIEGTIIGLQWTKRPIDDDDQYVQVLRADQFERDAYLEIHEVIVDHDQP